MWVRQQQQVLVAGGVITHGLSTTTTTSVGFTLENQTHKQNILKLMLKAESPKANRQQVH